MNQSIGQQWNIEDIGALLLFFRGQKVKKQCGHTAMAQSFSNNNISRAESARTAAMNESDERMRPSRNIQRSTKPQGRNANFAR